MAKVMMVLGDIWVGFGHEGGALMGGVSALVEEAPESSVAPSTMQRLQREVCSQGGGPLCGHAGTLASRTTREKTSVISCLVSGILLQ